jgi:16S rRNA (adenine1518-N6/adenine1519-N6)-dimethyltransferase
MVPKSSLEKSELHPRKKWGQNFLTDPRILQSIADAAEVDSGDTILEIGPGLGHLTRVLAARAKQVVAVEIDPELAARLSSEWAGSRTVKILQGDILSRQAAEWIGAENIESEGAGISPAPGFKVVANLPYYITSAILRHLLEAPIRPHLIVVMVQREVAQRITARPPEMNLLAVSVQFFAQVRVIRTIAPGAFFPRPKVESAVVRLDLMAQPPLPGPQIPRFFDLVRAGFGERRKQLRNSLAHGLHLDPPAASNLLTRAHIDPARRAETLRLDEWAELYRVWAHFPIVG